MSEEIAAPSSENADPVAVSLAMAGASRAKADAFLDDERHHLHEQERHMGLKLWELRMGVFLRVATLIVGIAVATAAGRMVWEAAHSNGLLIEPFSVPPDLAARGLTGQAVASQVLDKLTEMQNRTVSARPPQSYTNNWGSDLKVEIPETGVSLGELRRFLREWLGHDTHITGEVWRTRTGIAIIARAGGDRGETVFGTEDDLADAIQKAAENVYRVTQPYRYANYLDRFYQDTAPVPADAKTRLDQAQAIYRRLTYDPNPLERAWAWNGLGTQAWSGRGNVAAAIDYYHTALSIQQDFSVWLSALVTWTRAYGHAEESWAAAKRYLKGYPQSTQAQGFFALANGDFAELARVAHKVRASAPNPSSFDASKWNLEMALAGQHDGRSARRILGTGLQLGSHFARIFDARFRIATLVALQDWRSLLTEEPTAEQAIRATQLGWDFNTEFNRVLRPSLALARAQLDDVAGGQALIAVTPLDCYDCVRIRAQIADLAGKPAEADAWFAGAVHEGPSLPFAYADWGLSLLTRGKPDAAIAQFKLSNARAPHFADPLEGWGEALMAKNQSDRALAKFEEADKYAPNWGRLHLKWGEALIYAGKPAEAKAQFARAAALDLIPSERSELARISHVRRN